MIRKIATHRFGELEADPETFITFEKGMLGFPKCRDFIFIDASDSSPLKWLQSADMPELAFVITDPLLFKADYQPKITTQDLKELGAQNTETLITLVIVTVPRDPSKITANLKGPIIVNTANRKAKQLVLDDPSYDIKYRLLSDEEIAEAV